MPRLWNDTIESHRHAVHQAVLDTTAALVGAHGLAAVTMSQIAKDVGIGRATLYRYFPDVESILTAWHDRQIASHLDQLARAGDAEPDPGGRLAAVLACYARMSHGHHDPDLSRLLHRGQHVGRAQQRLRAYLTELIVDAAATGEVRADLEPGALADYSLSALTAAGAMPNDAAVDTLVGIILTGLRPPASAS